MFDNTFLRFVIVGSINTFVGGVFIFILYNVIETGYWLSSATSYILVTILSFFLNKYFTFGVKGWSAIMVISFVLTIVISYLIAYGVSRPVMNYLLRNNTQKIRENVALFTGMCLFTAVNYLGQRFIVFRIKGDKQCLEG